MATRILKWFIVLSTFFSLCAGVALASQDNPSELLFGLTVAVVAINATTLIVWEGLTRTEKALNEWERSIYAFRVEDDLEHDRSDKT